MNTQNHNIEPTILLDQTIHYVYLIQTSNDYGRKKCHIALNTWTMFLCITFPYKGKTIF